MSIIENLPFRDYKSDPATNNGMLRCYEESPLLCRKTFFDVPRLPEKKRTDDMLIGSATHTRWLEGERKFESEYCIRPSFYTDAKTGQVKPWTRAANYCKDWEETNGDGKEILSPEQNKLIETMLESLETNDDVWPLFKHGLPEVTLRNFYAGYRSPESDRDKHPVKGRLDWFDPENKRVIDLKTCDSLNEFEREIKHERRGRAWSYYLQVAWYRTLLALESDIGPAAALEYEYMLVAVEKNEPFRCGVYLLDPRQLDEGETQNENTYADLLASLRTGYWAGNPKGIQKVIWREHALEDAANANAMV